MALEQGLYAQVVMIRRIESDDIKDKDKTKILLPRKISKNKTLV